MQPAAESQRWHISQWGFWGWSETVFKGISICAGLLAFFASLSAPGFTLPSNSYLAAIVVLVLLNLLALVTVVLRFQQKEIISMIFSIPHALGHLGLLFALFRIVDIKGLALAFGIFWAIGQLFKLKFLQESGYTENGQNKEGMMRMNISFLVMYLLFAVFIFL